MRERRYGAGSPLQFPDRNIHLKIGDMTQQRITLFPKNKVQARRDDKISCSLSVVRGGKLIPGTGWSYESSNYVV